MKKYLLGQYEKSMPNDLSIIDKLKYSKEFGFDYLEISIDESDEKLARLDWDNETIKEINDAMLELNYPIKTMCLSGHRRYPLGHEDENIQQKSLTIAYKAIDLATKLGIRIIQLAGYDVYYEEGNAKTKQNFEKNLKKVVEYASTKGVLLGFETMETPFMDTVEKAMEYVNQNNSPYLGVYPDIGNLTNASLIYNNGVEEDILKGSTHIYAAHLKETKPGLYREIPFGEGHTDFINDINTLWNLGVRMFTGEWWAVKGRDWKKDCKEANEFLRSKIENKNA